MGNIDRHKLPIIGILRGAQSAQLFCDIAREVSDLKQFEGDMLKMSSTLEKIIDKSADIIDAIDTQNAEECGFNYVPNRKRKRMAEEKGAYCLDDYDIPGAVRDLILDLCANENEEAVKEPLVLIYEEKGEKTPCPKCGEPAAPIKNKPGVFYCKRCAGFICAEEATK